VFDISTVESYVYFDADWHCIADWNPLELDENPNFCCVRDRIWSEDVQRQAERLGLEKSDYFNAGFYVVNRKYHKHLMDYASEIYTDVPKQWGEQCVINKATHDLKIPKQFMSKRYNWMDYGGIDKYMNIIGLHSSYNYPIYEGREQLIHIPKIEWDECAMGLENGMADGSTFESRYWCITKEGIKICN
jgi:hypothetical protein